MDTPLTALTLPIVNDEGNVLDPRVKDAASLRSLYVKTRDADLQSDRERAKHQALVDGVSPYNQAKQNSTGQGYLSNFNPNDLKGLLDSALSAYTDLLSASLSVFDVFTTYGTEAEREEWSTIMSEQLGYVLRSWPLFYYRYSYLASFMTLHGVAVAYFEDPYNWQFNVSHLGQFKIPRQTKASEDEIEYAFLRELTQPHELLRYIKNEQIATEEGWNVPAVKRALLTAVSPTADTNLWQEFEAQIKNNDLVTGETAPAIKLIYSWIREADGSLSFYIITESEVGATGGNQDEYLFQKRHVYKSAPECFTGFTRGIGTNGTYHSIRGMGADVYNVAMQLMRLENRKVDIAFSAGPVLTAESEEAMQSLQITPYGPFMLATPGVVALNTQYPQITNTLQPAVNSMRETMSRNLNGYTSAADALNKTGEMSRFEAQARLEQAAQLSVTSINLFNQSMDRLAVQVVKRMARKDYLRSEPGGHYVWDWRQRCIENGVPAAAFDHIDHRKTRTARVIGFGSPAARRVALQNLQELAPYYDDYGRNSLVRNLTASFVGFEAANVYIPRASAASRVPVDYQIAELQNDVLAQGGQVTVSPSENKRVHLEVHVGKLTELIGQFDQAGQNPEMFAQIVPQMEPIYAHATETLQGYSGSDAPQYRQALQQAGEILVNGIRHLQKLQRQQEAEAMRQAEQAGQQFQPDQEAAQQAQVTNELERKVIEHQLKLQLQTQEAENRMQIKSAEAALQRQLRAADTAADIARKNAQQRAQMGIA